MTGGEVGGAGRARSEGSSMPQGIWAFPCSSQESVKAFKEGSGKRLVKCSTCT